MPCNHAHSSQVPCYPTGPNHLPSPVLNAPESIRDETRIAPGHVGILCFPVSSPPLTSRPFSSVHSSPVSRSPVSPSSGNRDSLKRRPELPRAPFQSTPASCTEITPGPLTSGPLVSVSLHQSPFHSLPVRLPFHPLRTQLQTLSRSFLGYVSVPAHDREDAERSTTLNAVVAKSISRAGFLQKLTDDRFVQDFRAKP